MQTLVMIGRLATEIVTGSLQGVFHLNESKLCHCVFLFDTTEVENMASQFRFIHQCKKYIYILYIHIQIFFLVDFFSPHNNTYPNNDSNEAVLVKDNSYRRDMRRVDFKACSFT
jgi:hypothetical protein